MIRLVVFDLDGTLVQTEKLKAISYARAAVELCPQSLREEQAIDVFREVVGRSRREVSETFVERFNLAEEALARQDGSTSMQPWQAFVQIRLKIYRELTSDPAVLRENRWPHNMDLLRIAKAQGCKTALATMSQREEANHVLEALGLTNSFDFIATRDDVENGKPDPEIYHLISACMNIHASRSLVVEDSPAGVMAARRAGMCVMAVTTPFTEGGFQREGVIEPDRIVNDTDQVVVVFERLMRDCSDRQSSMDD